MKINKECIICHKVFEFDLTEVQIKQLGENKLSIQNILSNLSPGDRELFISGICNDCFDKMFMEKE